MNGYPIGTVCVVTFNSGPEAFIKIGEVLSIMSEPFLWQPGAIHPLCGLELSPRDPCLGKVVQAVSKISRDGKTLCDHPVAWMRPLSDPDAVTETEREAVA